MAGTALHFCNTCMKNTQQVEFKDFVGEYKGKVCIVCTECRIARFVG